MSQDYLDIPARYEEHDSQVRLNKLERRLENTNRQGEVSDVKFDKDLKRWFVRYKEASFDTFFETDWRPWQTMANGAIKISCPPRKGQKVSLMSPGGYPEQAYVAPYHNDPDTPSPHDKEDEYFLRVEKPSEDGKPGTDKNKILDFHYTQDGATVSIGDTKHGLSKDSQSIKTKKDSIEADEHSAKTKSHTISTETRTVQAQSSTIQSAAYSVDGKIALNSGGGGRLV